jgi:hypothetical protein
MLDIPKSSKEFTGANLRKDSLLTKKKNTRQLNCRNSRGKFLCLSARKEDRIRVLDVLLIGR